MAEKPSAVGLKMVPTLSLYVCHSQDEQVSHKALKYSGCRTFKAACNASTFLSIYAQCFLELLADPATPGLYLLLLREKTQAADPSLPPLTLIPQNWIFVGNPRTKQSLCQVFNIIQGNKQLTLADYSKVMPRLVSLEGSLQAAWVEYVASIVEKALNSQEQTVQTALRSALYNSGSPIKPELADKWHAVVAKALMVNIVWLCGDEWKKKKYLSSDGTLFHRKLVIHDDPLGCYHVLYKKHTAALINPDLVALVRMCMLTVGSETSTDPPGRSDEQLRVHLQLCEKTHTADFRRAAQSLVQDADHVRQQWS